MPIVLATRAASAAFALLVAAQCASAAVQFNEIGYDMPGGDNGQEFVELRGTPGESLDGLTYLIIEGDAGASGGGGVVEHAISLNGLTLGSNGLLLIRDSATPLSPAPEAGTTLFVHDFAPDIENNTSNHLLVRNLNPSVVVGTDLDADGGSDDGIFDASPWDAVADAFTMLENSGVEYTYVTAAGNSSPAISGFNPDFAVRLLDGRWVAVTAGNGNSSGSSGGPYSLNNPGVELRFFDDGTLLNAALLDVPQLTPGGTNPALVPEPTLLASLIGLGTLATRRRR